MAPMVLTIVWTPMTKLAKAGGKVYIAMRWSTVGLEDETTLEIQVAAIIVVVDAGEQSTSSTADSSAVTSKNNAFALLWLEGIGVGSFDSERVQELGSWHHRVCTVYVLIASIDPRNEEQMHNSGICL